MLQPKKTKFRKQFKGRIHGTATGGTDLNFGQFGLKALEPERVNARQIEAARRAITRQMKRQGRVWRRIFPDGPVSANPTGGGMGKGKGEPQLDWKSTRLKSRPRNISHAVFCLQRCCDPQDLHPFPTLRSPDLFGLKPLQPERVNARQIEAARRAITRQMKRQGRVWIRIFPDVPVSSKPTEVRMGKGKGAPEFWAARVKPGRIMFEIDGVPEDIAREALRLGAAKLPIKTRFIQRIAE